MRELTDDPLYELLDEYGRLIVDYCLMESETPHRGLWSHKEAVTFAMEKQMAEYPWILMDADRAAAEVIASDVLFSIPDKPWKEIHAGTTVYHVDFSKGGKIPYWYAFLEPPHKTGPVIINGKMVRKEYGTEDFERMNRVLFPEGTDALEVYDWSTDWSNYFDAGREWWGTLCCSVYDKRLNRYVVIMASVTD